MTRLVIIQGDGPEWLVDLDKNPDIEKRIDAGELKVIKKLDKLPPDPWAKEAAHSKKQAEAKATKEAEEAAAAEREAAEKAKAEAEAEEKAKAVAAASAGSGVIEPPKPPEASKPAKGDGKAD